MTEPEIEDEAAELDAEPICGLGELDDDEPEAE